MRHQKIKIIRKGTEGPAAIPEVLDAETGEKIENIRGIHIMMGVDKLPIVTIEQFQPELETDIEALAEIRGPQEQTVRDKRGQLWVNSTWLAGVIRKDGVMCQRNGALHIMHEFSDDLLREWEGVESGPTEGRNKEKTHV